MIFDLYLLCAPRFIHFLHISYSLSSKHLFNRCLCDILINQYHCNPKLLGSTVTFV
ncbi:hypothetical protein HanRHA438_Chr07g0303281 [Helianthus annuus]|nr:hypothetical protein HanRHA438_Chr07g0303281 [Helianthus annuus]